MPGAMVQALAPDGGDDDIAVLVARVALERAHPPATLAIDPSAPAVVEARAFARTTLDAWDLPDLVLRDAILLVSEMVTNAIVHGRPPICLRLRRGRSRLLIEVDDTATAVPRKLRPTPTDVHGRGLQLVAALAEAWGTRPTASGKSVWCALAIRQ
jgi:hypothetical protein